MYRSSPGLVNIVDWTTYICSILKDAPPVTFSSTMDIQLFSNVSKSLMAGNFKPSRFHAGTLKDNAQHGSKHIDANPVILVMVDQPVMK